MSYGRMELNHCPAAVYFRPRLSAAYVCPPAISGTGRQSRFARLLVRTRLDCNSPSSSSASSLDTVHHVGGLHFPERLLLKQSNVYQYLPCRASVPCAIQMPRDHRFERGDYVRGLSCLSSSSVACARGRLHVTSTPRAAPAGRAWWMTRIRKVSPSMPPCQDPSSCAPISRPPGSPSLSGTS